MVHMDIRERLAEALLYEVDPEEFQAKPVINMATVDDVTTRVYTSFASGQYFETISKHIRELNKDGIALCLTFGIDETTLNTTRSRTSSLAVDYVHSKHNWKKLQTDLPGLCSVENAVF